MDAPTLEQLTTVAGATILTALLTQLVLNVWRPSADQKDRFGPFLAIIIGVVVTVVATFAIGGAGSQQIVAALINGIFAGAAAMGVHDTIDSATAP